LVPAKKAAREQPRFRTNVDHRRQAAAAFSLVAV
jgi:hypothetical protein